MRWSSKINKVMGRRVSLQYEEKVGLPTTCFGETRSYVINVAEMAEIPLGPGVVLPNQPAPAAQPAASPAQPAAPATPAASR